MAPRKTKALPSSEPPIDLAATELTLKQERFCRAYVDLNGNGRQAAIQAGYSQDTATEMATENLRKPHVLRYVHHLLERRREAERVGKDDLFALAARKLRASLEADPLAILQGLMSGTLTEEQRLAVKKIKPGAKGGAPEIEVHDWVPQLAALSKIKGWDAPQKVELESKNLHTVRPDLEGMTQDELQRYLHEQLSGRSS